MPGSFQGVLGRSPAAELGFTISHEHLIGRPLTGPLEPDLVLDDLDRAAAEMEAYRAAGGSAIVEVTPVDYGRDLPGLAALSRRTGVHVIGVTGLHKERWSGPFTADRSVEELAETFVRDLQEGVQGVRAGLIKVGSSTVLTEGERRAFLAAARAHLATGAPITTHTEHGRLAHEQLDLLLPAGVDPARIVVGHLDLAPDLEYHHSVLRRGVYIAYDQVGKAKYGSDEERAAALAGLVARGHEERLLISGDFARRGYWRSWGGGPGLAHIPTTFLAMLAAAGVPPAAVQAMVVDNPARVFAYLP